MQYRQSQRKILHGHCCLCLSFILTTGCKWALKHCGHKGRLVDVSGVLDVCCNHRTGPRISANPVRLIIMWVRVFSTVA